MGKYLELFRGEVGDLTEKTKLENKPYVCYSTKLGKVTYTVVPAKEPIVDLTVPYVTFRAEEAGSTIGLVELSKYQTLEYSTDTITWNNMNASTIITLLNANDEVYIRGILRRDNGADWIIDEETGQDIEVYYFSQFEMTGKISSSGNCNAIWNYQDLNAPLKAYCGYFMFKNCTSLTTAPELPATELNYDCYASMFEGCTSLTGTPELPATKLASCCYQGMFEGCTSLTVAPELPATTLADFCYSSMFDCCTSLTTAPELPATELDYGCYASMFEGCTSLTVAPELPALIILPHSYDRMFFNCSMIGIIKCLASSKKTPSENDYDPYLSYTDDWVRGVHYSGTFYKHLNATWWARGTDGIPSGWTVVDAEV